MDWKAFEGAGFNTQPPEGGWGLKSVYTIIFK